MYFAQGNLRGTPSPSTVTPPQVHTPQVPAPISKLAGHLLNLKIKLVLEKSLPRIAFNLNVAEIVCRSTLLQPQKR